MFVEHDTRKVNMTSTNAIGRRFATRTTPSQAARLILESRCVSSSANVTRSTPSRSISSLKRSLRWCPGVTVIVGHSGAGKTTILRCVAGLTDPEEGRIAVGDRLLFDSKQMINIESARRRVGFVFQDLALFPHLSVQDNVTYGLRRLDEAERERRLREVLEAFQIEHLCKRFPREISGGEQQRVALARSLVTEPSSCSWTSHCLR